MNKRLLLFFTLMFAFSLGAMEEDTNALVINYETAAVGNELATFHCYNLLPTEIKSQILRRYAETTNFNQDQIKDVIDLTNNKGMYQAFHYNDNNPSTKSFYQKLIIKYFNNGTSPLTDRILTSPKYKIFAPALLQAFKKDGTSFSPEKIWSGILSVADNDATIKYVVANGYGINYSTSRTSPLLQSCSRRSDLNTCTLIELGADIKALPEQKLDPTFIAIAKIKNKGTALQLLINYCKKENCELDFTQAIKSAVAVENNGENIKTLVNAYVADKDFNFQLLEAAVNQEHASNTETVTTLVKK